MFKICFSNGMTKFEVQQILEGKKLQEENNVLLKIAKFISEFIYSRETI